ncbi:MAG: T9SS type A sorting domain-containing protein, partial [Bacteroidota bacterium]
ICTDGGVWSSNDSGVTWIQHHVGLPITNVPANYKTVKDLYINGNAIIAATTAGIYRSTDQANTWTQVSSLACNDLQKYGSYLYATGNGVFRSNDNGLTWTAFAGATSGGPFDMIAGAGGKIFTIANQANMLYADTTATSFSNNGNDQIKFILGYENLLFYIGTGGYINYYDVNLSVTSVIDASSNLPCYQPAAGSCYEPYLSNGGISVFGDNLWLGTSGFSTWYRSLADFGFPVGLNNAQTEKLEIKPYPNPANEIIYFNNLAKADQIEIFNNLGQLQRTILNIDNNGIDISNLAKGFYIYAITDEQHRTKSTGKFIKD